MEYLWRTDNRLPNPKWYVPAVIVFTILFVSLLRACSADEIHYGKLHDSIIAVESSWQGNAYNRHSKATGLGQITPIALKDFNQLNNERYTMRDMQDPQKNMRVSYWLLEERIPQLLRYYGFEVTIENVAACYNAGIGTLVKSRKQKRKLPEETRHYIVKVGRALQNS